MKYVLLLIFCALVFLVCFLVDLLLVVVLHACNARNWHACDCHHDVSPTHQLAVYIRNTVLYLYFHYSSDFTKPIFTLNFLTTPTGTFLIVTSMVPVLSTSCSASISAL